MPAPPDAFANLEDLLLKGGIAPRHVRRYLRELSEHLADLTEAERRAGHDAAEAEARARAALGPDRDLADAMLKQRDFRSFSARFPRTVFGLMPLLALMLAAVLQIVLFALLMRVLGYTAPPHIVRAPEKIAAAMTVVPFFGNFALIPGIALLFVLFAARQRRPLVWPVLSTLLVLGLSLHWENGPSNPQGWGAAGLSYNIQANVFRFSITPMFLPAWWQSLPAHGFTFAAQYLLTLLPLGWLLRAGRKAAT